ncbi:hypothetical protein A3860_08890 [Niastella vici]|uniref:Deoxynucleoside kinase domain-containing protein n=1 Tax=Niastella vici TaxID=1703345 RepID=A0A1V9FHA3_9BACT|nr:hypothetical protein [Niastella vici]OQP57734.1 hypothetical protein A3860_08890 [Niastella vici]
MKPKIIEIIGPPGVGKSAIYKSLCRTWKPGSQWAYPDVLLTARPHFFSARKWLAYHLRMVLHRKLTKTIPVEYGLRFAAKEQELAAFCWKLISYIQFYNDDEINQRYRSAYFLFTTFSTYQAVLENASEKPCIIEEGFLQKSFFIRDTKVDEPLTNCMLDKYLQLAPLPYAVIYMDIPDNSEIVKRLRGRNKIIASHSGKDDAALLRDIENWRHVQHIILEKIQQAGVGVVRFNGHQPVKENVARIIKLLKKIETTRDAGSENNKEGSTLNLITQSC